MITETEKILLINSIDLTIENISNSIINIPDDEVKSKARDLRKQYISLSDKIDKFKTTDNIENSKKKGRPNTTTTL
ncbi:MAG: hypothetical protein HRT87_07605 [Legionellales bacterium]|jgi:hypothetical protein|nr:hypothetical protein [Legionellales bacterium]